MVGFDLNMDLTQDICVFGGAGLDCDPPLKNSLWIDPSLVDKHGQGDR